MISTMVFVDKHRCLRLNGDKDSPVVVNDYRLQGILFLSLFLFIEDWPESIRSIIDTV